MFKLDAPPCEIHIKSGKSPRIHIKNRSKYRTPLHVNVHPELCKTETDFFREFTFRFILFVSVVTVPHERRWEVVSNFSHYCINNYCVSFLYSFQYFHIVLWALRSRWVGKWEGLVIFWLLKKKLEGSVLWLLLCFLWQSFAAHIDFNEHQGGSNGSSAALFVN